MEKLQGEVIPRFIGSFKVQLPGSESELFATVMSYIPGMHFSDLVESLPYGKGPAEDHEEWYPYARELLKTIYDFHQMGICEFDIRSGNVLVVQGGQDLEDRNLGQSPQPLQARPKLRFIDFTLTRPTTFPCFDERERSGPRTCLGKEGDVPGAWWLFREFVERERRCWRRPWPRPRYQHEGWASEILGKDAWELDAAEWKFVQWVARNYPGDAWIAEHWEPEWREHARWSPAHAHTPVFANQLCRIS